MNTRIIGIIISFVFLIAVIGGFFWVWTQTKNFTVDTKVASNLKPVEIASTKTEAITLLSGLQKFSDIPIPVPVEKMGKANPFELAQ